MLDSVLLMLAKVAIAFIVISFLVRWFIIIPFLYFVYDRKINELKTEITNIKDKARHESGHQTVIERRRDYALRPLEEQLELLELRRKLFIDRANLFISILRIK